MKKLLMTAIVLFMFVGLFAQYGFTYTGGGGSGSFTKAWIRILNDATIEGDIILYGDLYLNNSQYIYGRNNADSAYDGIGTYNTSDRWQWDVEQEVGPADWGDNPGVVTPSYITISGTNASINGFNPFQIGGYNMLQITRTGDGAGDSDTPYFKLPQGAIALKEITTPTALADYGQIYTKSDNRVYFQDGAGTEHELGEADAHYGEMYIINNSTAITVNSQDNWQAVATLLLEGETEGFTYEAGTSGTDISAYADSSGTHTTVTTTGAHALAIGDYITIDGTTNYDGVMKVTSSADNTHFVVEWVYVADDATGNYARGVSLTCDAGSGGLYKGIWQASGQSADANQVFKFSPCKNATQASKAKATRKFTNTDDGSFGGTALMNVSDGDKIFFIIYNDTSAGNITIETFDLNLARL